jgi:hypothetical protein
MIIQGSVSSLEEIEFLIHNIKKMAPGLVVIVSTSSPVIAIEGCDRLIQVPDVGGLPYIKNIKTSLTNNINRQIQSTFAGLGVCTTKYAIKLRADCRLEDFSFIDYGLKHGVDDGKILTSNLFTIDPTMFEHLSYHMSDWFQFGLTDKLKQYWSAPFMSIEDATYYDRNFYRAGSSYMDKQFRTRLAVEQYLGVHYAQQLGYIVPRFHNELTPEILESFYQFIKNEFIIMDADKVKLSFPKYKWAFSSGFQNLNCISNLDYLIITGKCESLDVCRKRKFVKQVFRSLSSISDHLGFIFYRKHVKRIVSWLLKVTTRVLSR